MMASRPEVLLESMNQNELDWLVRQGVSTSAMVRPTAVTVTTGFRAEDGQFEYAAGGARWLAFEQEEDFVFWQPRGEPLATYGNRAFALGEDMLAGASTFSLGYALQIFASPLDWLRTGRDGIVVLDWSRAFERLRDAPRIAIVEALLPTYHRHMRPSRMPEVFVVRSAARAAA